MDGQAQLREKLSIVPEQPGCYLMRNKAGDILYVGKAKVLRHRIRSYFTGSHDAKTQRLVIEIADFEYIVTRSNTEALLLECNLIKKHRPRYNVLLKDDKTYPYIKLTNEDHPRLEVTRRVVKDRARYYGPYPNAHAAQQTKKLLDRLYPLRKCKVLPDRVCLYYHLGQCLAPCEFEVSNQDYETMLQNIHRFLSGAHSEIKAGLKEKMLQAADALEFERAKELRDQIVHIDMVIEQQNMTSAAAEDRDIFGYAIDKGQMSVQILHMRQGKLLERKAAIFTYYGENAEDFSSYVLQHYEENPALPKEVLLPSFGDDEKALIEALYAMCKLRARIPQRGSKKDFVETANENAKLALAEKFQLMERDEERTSAAANKLGEWIGIEKLSRIEAFDNSTLQGDAAVAAMVVFRDGRPNREAYRKYKIRSVTGPDDVGAMREVIRRRYERLLKEDGQLPDLIVVDGGKGQISAAVDVLENELGLFIPICGLAKDDRHKTAQLLFGNPPEAIPLPRSSKEFMLLQRIQEEVHRFAISFHRQTRQREFKKSTLDKIPGIGEKRRRALLLHFGSLKRIREAKVEDFREVGIGEQLAQTILRHLQNER